MAGGKLLVYLLRRDLRVADNPVLHYLATSPDHGYTHLLPLYVFPSHQVEVSGFLNDGEKSPFAQARSQVGGFWRCGPHRAKFLAQSVWGMKEALERIDSGLIIRVGAFGDVLQHLIAGFKEQGPAVGGVWMTEEMSYEEVEDQEAIAAVCSGSGIEFKLWPDEKYFVDDRDNGLEKPSELPDVFTSYRKSQEPLRDRPRSPLPQPDKSVLPPLPELQSVPSQGSPFTEAQSLEDLETRLLKPLDPSLANPPPFPEGAMSAHPFHGGENNSWARLQHLIKSGSMTAYKDTRNGLIGSDFSTKLSAYLAIGCISARQIHKEVLDFEDGKNAAYESGEGYGQGENEGTRGVRFELLWRDYMRLCTMKFGRRLFRLSGFKDDASYDKKWKTADKSSAAADQQPSPDEIKKTIDRFLEGTTGMGLIDAAQRELFHTGYASNRTRQNVASFFSKHLGIDWRYGAEWYEMMLVDYDVSSNWANWQYVSGVGNDPRGDARIFNPVKQAFDYDKDGSYVRMWVPEVKELEKLENVFQACTASPADLEKCGIADHAMVTNPVKRIEFSVDKKPKTSRKPFTRRRGQGRGGRRGGGGGAVGGSQGNNGNNGQGEIGNNTSTSKQDGRPAGQGANASQNQQPKQQAQQIREMGSAYNGTAGTAGTDFKDMKGPGVPNYYYPESAPNGGAYAQQQFGDPRWFSNSWGPYRGGGRGRGRDYGNGNGNGNGYRGRGGRRGRAGFYNRDAFGGPHYMNYYQTTPHYYPYPNMGPAA